MEGISLFCVLTLPWIKKRKEKELNSDHVEWYTYYPANHNTFLSLACACTCVSPIECIFYLTLISKPEFITFGTCTYVSLLPAHTHTHRHYTSNLIKK